VLADEVIRHAHHFAAAQPEAGFLEALQDIAAMALGKAIGFEKNQGAFHRGFTLSRNRTRRRKKKARRGSPARIT
jgi:hypothetical protein